MAKLDDSKKQICETIMNMTPEIFYNLCFDLEYYNMNYGFDIFDCAKCNALYGCNQTYNNPHTDECFDKFMEYYEVDKYATKKCECAE